MATGGREARRRRILEGGQDRLALITGRKPNVSSDFNDSGSSPPLMAQDHLQDFKSLQPVTQASVPQNEEDKSLHFISPTQDQAAMSTQDDALVGRSEEEPFVRKSASGTEPSRAPATEDGNKGESSPAVTKVTFTVFDAVRQLAQQASLGNITSQQVSFAVADTEHDRMLCALAIAILVVLSYAGFPIVSCRIFRSIILFRPLFLVLIANITLIARRLLPENQKKMVRGPKDDNKPLLGDEYAWAEEAGRALEVGLMLQNVVGSLFIDCSVYVAIVVFGLSLFG